jgi:hypothetical protein
VGEPRADRDVAVARQRRRDEGQQRARVGREVDVHVGDDARVAARPRLAQRAAAALAIEAQVRDAAQLRLQLARDLLRAVRARVVGDDDPPAEREGLAEEAVQAADALLERRLLVVDRDDHLHVARGRRGKRAGPQRARLEEGRIAHAGSVGRAGGSAVGAG